MKTKWSRQIAPLLDSLHHYATEFMKQEAQIEGDSGNDFPNQPVQTGISKVQY